MMKTMRKMTKLILWFVVLAFVGTIIFAWGMEFSTRRSKQGLISRVNGQDVSIQLFNFLSDQQERQYETNQGEVNEDIRRQIRDQVWEQLINETLLLQEARKRNITVTDKELFEYMRRYPPPEVQQNEAFQTDGNFDYQKYLQALNDPRVSWGPLEALIRPNLSIYKLQDAISNLARVDEEEVKTEFYNKNEQIKIRYIFLLAKDFYNQVDTITREEIEKYYQDHKAEFKQEAQVNLAYVEFPKAITVKDEEEIKSRLEEIRQKALAGADFAELARQYSDDRATALKGGDLGWFEKGAMVRPFEDAVVALKKNQISSLVKTNYGWHIIKLEDRKKEKGKEQFKASHILLRLVLSPEKIEKLRQDAFAFAQSAKVQGFETAVTAQKYSLRQTGFINKNGPIPALGDNPQVLDFAKKGKKGDLSSAIETDLGFYILKIQETKAAGTPDLTDGSVFNLVKATLKLQKAVNLANQKAQKIHQELLSGKPFEQVSQDNQASFDNPGFFSRASFIPRIGNTPEVIGAAFRLNSQNRFSPPIKTPRVIYILEFLERQAPSDSAYLAVQDSLYRTLLGQKKNAVYTSWFDNLKKNAKIEDYREQYFREVSPTTEF